MEQCLNCGRSVNAKFCEACGQKTDTHRITVSNFIAHDLLHGVWHLEKGILFTLKEALIRPGQAALDYIKGKRIRYYNVFYLSLLIIALNILLVRFYNKILADNYTTTTESVEVFRFLRENLKLLLLGIVPVLALNAKLIFRRLNLNIAEHFIVGGMTLLGILIISIIFFFLNFIVHYVNSDFMGLILSGFFFLMILFPLWSYANAIKGLYRSFGMFWRVALFYFISILELIFLLGLIVWAATGQTEIYV
jgi:hypothetical protein